jgi:ABC-type transport system involved in multi-copper enzyme maturation permease subunit
MTDGVLQLLPALIGAFVGAPLLAREFETGTFRYAWTQGFGRTRWTVATLVPLAIFVALAAELLSLAFLWYYQPLVAAGDDNGFLYPTVFDLTGVALTGWTLLAFAVGSLAGVLIRRVVPAMFATVAIWAVPAILTGTTLRAHYSVPAVTHSIKQPTSAWILSEQWLAGGKPASLDMINQTLSRIDARAETFQVFSPGRSTPANVDPVRYLTQHGFELVTTYQPDSRFWMFQLTEGLWLLGLSVLLLGAAIWIVRRRAS